MYSYSLVLISSLKILNCNFIYNKITEHHGTSNAIKFTGENN